MDFEKIKITDITPANYNPRVMTSDEKTKLTNSIKEFGLVDPIIINLNNNTIIGGHQRYDVLLDQYMIDNNLYAELNLIRLGDIGWVFIDEDLILDDTSKEKALNLALNRINGEWDLTKLGEVFKDLKEIDFDLDLTGFNSYDEELEYIGLMDKIEFTTDEKTKTTNNSSNNTVETIDENENNDEYLETEENISESEKVPGYYHITLIFDTEDEMVTEYDNLISQGYNCRMSNS
ncbi:MAG: ParB N-terminal domain-containing protein [Methanobrevibacter sp.]|nr:ParB N-terminal domain-containing protein [Methanosphaera sp.]MBR0371043.1 ParB N-terminal domain-containing protein [Methanobrevibacter sp.]